MFRNTLRSWVAVASGACLLIGGYLDASAAVNCATVLRMHGMLRWGAGQCALTEYNPDVREDARRCFERLGSSVAVPLMYAGRDEFERLAASRGRDALCGDIARRFSMVVR